MQTVHYLSRFAAYSKIYPTNRSTLEITPTNTMSGTYKPTEHGGLKQDGSEDARVGTGDFAHGKVDPSEAGKSGGQASGGTGSGSSGGDNYKPTEHGGQTKDGGVDGRVKQ